MPSLIRTKSGIYYIVSTHQGKRTWRSTGTRKRSEALHMMSTAPSPKVSQGVTLSRSIADYLPHVETNFARKTYQVYALALKHFQGYAGDVKVQTIEPQFIDAFKVQRARRVSPATVNIELRSIRAFFNTLKRWGVLTLNPCDGIRQLRIDEQPPLYFTEVELKALIDSIRDSWLSKIVTFAAMTGARLGEILNLRWDDVDINRKSITIRSSDSYRVKGGRMRTIPMNNTIIALLESVPEREGTVFRGMRGGRANANFVSEKFRDAVRRHNFGRRLHFHSLRHTFASLLVQKRVSLYQVQKLLGHSSVQITEKYAHLSTSGMQEVVNEIELR